MIRIILIALIFFPFFAGTLLAGNEVDVQRLRTLNLTEKPREVVATADGQRIYVLTEKGNVQLFSANGDPLGTFDAGPDVTGISPQGKNRLILEIGQQKQLMLIALEPIVQLTVQGVRPTRVSHAEQSNGQQEKQSYGNQPAVHDHQHDEGPAQREQTVQQKR